MDALNIWIVDNLGLWTADCFGLILILAAVLVLVLLVMIIIVIARHCIIKKQMKALREKANASSAENADKPNEEELRKKIREELEREYKDKQHAPAQAPAQAVDIKPYEEKIDALEITVKQQMEKINELTAQLDEATDKSQNAHLYRALNELNQKAKALESENAELKATEKPDNNGEPTVKLTTKKAAPKKTTKKPEPEPEPEPEEDDEEYDDDEFADESSNIKVTLKFDRAKGNWVITRSDMTRAYRRLATKQEALVIAKDLARTLRAHLAVHKKDGKFQKV